MLILDQFFAEKRKDRRRTNHVPKIKCFKLCKLSRQIILLKRANLRTERIIVLWNFIDLHSGKVRLFTFFPQLIWKNKKAWGRLGIGVPLKAPQCDAIKNSMYWTGLKKKKKKKGFTGHLIT